MGTKNKAPIRWGFCYTYPYMHYLVILGAAANIVGTSFYIRDTFRGTTKPNRVTWLLWSVIPFIAFAAELAAGVRWATLPVFAAGFTPFMVLCASFFNRNSYWKLGTLHYLCCFLSIIAIVLWQLTGEPSVAIGFAILADTLATVPTYVKTWSYPETESSGTYFGGVFSAATGMIVLPSFTFNGLAFLVYAASTCLILIFLIYRKRIASSFGA